MISLLHRLLLKVDENNGNLDYSYNYTVKKVTDDIENLRLNTFVKEGYHFNGWVIDAMTDNPNYVGYTDGQSVINLSLVEIL